MSSGDNNREPKFDCGRFKSQFLWAHGTFAALAVFVCAGFTASASWALLGFSCLSGATEGGPSIPRLAMKAVFFSALLAASIAGLHALYRRKPGLRESLPGRTKSPSGRTTMIALLVSLGIVALATIPRLSVFPHIEPDESHHLIVARNVAVHGVYGSGMPATGFRPFDDYDSVGPTVLLPVAAAIWAFGEPLHSGRVIMALFFLLLCALVYLLVARSTNTMAGVFAVLFLLAAPGSLYLARTLYGEAPALLYLIAALFVWERALDSARPLSWCVASGALFGCALTTKYFLVVAAWPALGMWVYDWMTFRRIRLVHALVPTGVALAMLASWVGVTSLYGPHGTDTPGGHLSMYQHNLLFGLDSVGTALSWLAQHWIAAVFYLVVGIYSLTTAALLTAYRPACLLLALFALLIAYWWIFFTTGAIPRYLWYAMAIGAAFAGTFCASGFSRSQGKAARYRRFAYIASTVMLVFVAWETAPRIAAMATRDEMQDEYAVVDHLVKHYDRAAVATTFYPIQRVANLLAEFPVDRVRTTDSWQEYDAVVLDARSQTDAIGDNRIEQTFGRYAIITAKTKHP
ncbi:MAG: glycosyltransferase family 39 protein [Candidatus Hydrogenedentes bacterium]|nr:glycosyltransferase family 39 protein [Candidatus Hydrogenedentota bacterium]